VLGNLNLGEDELGSVPRVLVIVGSRIGQL
jgi:hypothetical protein